MTQIPMTIPATRTHDWLSEAARAGRFALILLVLAAWFVVVGIAATTSSITAAARRR